MPGRKPGGGGMPGRKPIGGGNPPGGGGRDPGGGKPPGGIMGGAPGRGGPPGIPPGGPLGGIPDPGGPAAGGAAAGGRMTGAALTCGRGSIWPGAGPPMPRAGPARPCKAHIGDQSLHGSIAIHYLPQLLCGHKIWMLPGHRWLPQILDNLKAAAALPACRHTHSLQQPTDAQQSKKKAPARADRCALQEARSSQRPLCRQQTQSCFHNTMQGPACKSHSPTASTADATPRQQSCCEP